MILKANPLPGRERTFPVWRLATAARDRDAFDLAGPEPACPRLRGGVAAALRRRILHMARRQRALYIRRRRLVHRRQHGGSILHAQVGKRENRSRSRLCRVLRGGDGRQLRPAAGRWTATGDVVLAATMFAGRGLVAGCDVDVGQVHFLVGRIDRWLDIGGGGLLRQWRNDVLDRRLARCPDHDLRHRDLLIERDVSKEVGLDEGLRPRLGLRHLAQDRLTAGRGFAAGCRLGGGGMRAGIGDAGFGSSPLLVGHAQIEKAGRVVLRVHFGDGRLVRKSEANDGHCETVNEDRYDERCRPRASVEPVREKCNGGGRYLRWGDLFCGALRMSVKPLGACTKDSSAERAGSGALGLAKALARRCNCDS